MDKNKVFAILMMRFNVDPYQAFDLIADWFSKHQEKSWTDLKQLLLTGKIIVKNQVLHDVNPVEVANLVKQMRGENGLKIKDRWHKFRIYRKTFVACQAVKWLMETQNTTRNEAIQLGQILVDRKIIYNVNKAAFFRDEYSFYSFYQNRTRSSVANSVKKWICGKKLLNV